METLLGTRMFALLLCGEALENMNEHKNRTTRLHYSGAQSNIVPTGNGVLHFPHVIDASIAHDC